MKTPIETPQDADRHWYVIDAKDEVLGKVAVKVASLVRGKHKSSFTRNQEMGDYVIIINSAQAKMTGNKVNDKLYYRHSGYIGGLKTTNYKKLVAAKPTEPLRLAIKGMLPRGPLGNKLLKNVKIYTDDNHPHLSQNPENIQL